MPLSGEHDEVGLERTKFNDVGNTSDSDWCTIESDPGVFTEMLEMLGCKAVELEELYSLDDESLIELQQSTRAIYGLIFLFEWKPTKKAKESLTSSREALDESQTPESLFFAQQVTTNACATQAVLSVLFNAVHTEGGSGCLGPEELGTVLSDFRTFVSTFPAHLKGVAISSSEELKTVHNAFSSKATDSLYLTQDRNASSSSSKGEAFHFVAYVPHAGIVYELDGLQKGPIVIGSYSDSSAEKSEDVSGGGRTIPSWLAVARTAIQERMITAGEDSVKFNLMAVIHDKRQMIRERLRRKVHDSNVDSIDRIERIESIDHMDHIDTIENIENMNSISSNNDINGLQSNNNAYSEYHNYMDETVDLGDIDSSHWHQRLAAEQAKRDRWKVENQRRRHNYVPFCIQYLRELAKLKASVQMSVPDARLVDGSTDMTVTKRKLELVIEDAKNQRRQRQGGQGRAHSKG